MKPIEKLIQNIVMTKVDMPTKFQKDMPYVTHEGILELGEIKIKVFQLNTGLRVIPEKELERVLKIIK